MSARRSSFWCSLVLATLCGTPVAAETSPRRVEVPGGDGFALRATYHAGAPGARAILLLHQCDRESGAPTGFEALAELLGRRGFHVLVPDLRGYGASRSADFTGHNWQEAQAHFRRDVAALHHFLAAQPGVDATRSAVVGASCGGREAIHLAASQPAIGALVLLSSRLGGPVLDVVATLGDRAIFALAAEGDRAAAETALRAFGLSTHDSSRLALYKGAAHGTALLDADPALAGTIADWISARLLDPGDAR